MYSVLTKRGLDMINRLLEKYGDNDYAMYVEYPHKSCWLEKYCETDFKMALKNLFSKNKEAPLALYLHIPFCPRQCYFCICYSVVTRDYERIKRYLGYLFREIDMLRAFFDENSFKPNFKEIHFGGGSPTYLSEEDFDRLIEKVQTLVDIHKTEEVTLEIDPREVTSEKLIYYRSKGVNRLSLGVQDFDLNVQKAVNRIQPTELIESLLTPDIRKAFYNGVNFDILCGLPRQTRNSFKNTIDKLIELSPDRTCVIYVSYSPGYRKHQNLIDRSEVPNFHERAMLLEDAVCNLLNNGYVRIGFDHFAKETDTLAKAMERKDLHWNGLGYRAGEFVDIIGVGASSASRITEYHYSQNFYELPNYEMGIDNGKFPIYRGFKLTKDDVIRRDIIHKLRCYFSLDFRQIEQQFNIDFDEYFQEEKPLIKGFEEDGLIEVSDNNISITTLGVHFTYYICRIFDKLNRLK